MMDLANLKEVRRSLGVSQIKLANLVGVTMLTIRLWENGAGTPNEVNRAKLEEVLNQLSKAPTTQRRKKKSKGVSNNS